MQCLQVQHASRAVNRPCTPAIAVLLTGDRCWATRRALAIVLISSGCTSTVGASKSCRGTQPVTVASRNGLALSVSTCPSTSFYDSRHHSSRAADALNPCALTPSPITLIRGVTRDLSG